MSKELAIKKFRNTTNVEFENISGKKMIEYHFPNGSHITIQKPIYIAILPTGENLIYDQSENCYKIRPKIGWWKKWTVTEDHPHFTTIDVVSIDSKNSQVEMLNS